MYAAIRDTRLYFDVEGAGLVPDGAAMREKPVLFLVHGGPGSDHSGYKPLFSAFADAAQLVYFDHRGQGRSARNGDPARWTLDENVADMEALRRHLGLGPIAVVGTSYGGMVAMAHAARHPGSVSRLVLVATAAHGGFIARAREILAERGSAEQKALVARCWDQGFRDDEDVRHYHRVMGPIYALRFDAAAAEPALQRAAYAHGPLNAAFGPEGFLRRFDLRPELPRITAPTLVLAGAEDWICPPEFAREIAALIPGAQLEVFEGAGHSLRTDAPDRLLAAIRRFVLG